MVSGLGRAREREQQAGEGRRGNGWVGGWVGGWGLGFGQKGWSRPFFGFFGLRAFGAAAGVNRPQPPTPLTFFYGQVLKGPLDSRGGALVFGETVSANFSKL